MEDLQPRVTAFAAALGEVDAALDWDLLGRLYCHEGGEAFFPEEQRDAIRDAGLAFAADLGGLLAPGGASHYVGAAVAELPQVLFETIVLERRVHWSQLAGEEQVELARAMAAVDGPPPTTDAHPPFDVDHLWCASVLTDPDAFPALHDHLYEREGLGGDLDADRARAEALVAETLEHLAPPAIVSTTDEEAPFFLAACAARGWRLTFPERGRLSGVVGDVVRHGSVTDERQ